MAVIRDAEEIEFENLAVHVVFEELIKNLPRIGSVCGVDVYRDRDVVFVVFDGEYPWILALELEKEDVGDDTVISAVREYLAEHGYSDC